jgi:hypothetical protein
VVVGGDLDDAIEKMAHVVPAAMCEQHLADTTDTPITRFPIRDQEEPEWCQHLEAACGLTLKQFDAGWAQNGKVCPIPIQPPA